MNRYVNSLNYLTNYNLNFSYTDNLNFEDEQLSPKDIKFTCQVLRKCCHLRKIFFKNQNAIGKTKQKFFKNLVNSSIFIEDFQIISCQLNKRNVKQITKLFSECSNLKTVKFSEEISIGKTNSPIFENLCLSANSLNILDFSKCNLNKKNMVNLSNLFSKCSNLKSINLSYNSELGNTKLPIFLNLQNSASNLERLNFSDCQFNKENIKIVFEFLKNCKKLKSINLSGNYEIGNVNLPIFLSLISLKDTLEDMDFSDCMLNEDNIDDISCLLLFCNKLKSVNFNNNYKIGLTENEILKHLLHSSQTLKFIKIQNCFQNDYPIADINLLIQMCYNLIEIDWL